MGAGIEWPNQVTALGPGNRGNRELTHYPSVSSIDAIATRTL